MGTYDYSKSGDGMHQGLKEYFPSPCLELPVKIGSKASVHNRAQPQAKQGLQRSKRKACPVANNLPSPQHTKRSKTLQKAVDAKPNPFRKSWRDLWRHEKLSVASEAAYACSGLAFSLNLSQKRQAMLSGRADPADDLRRYISREIRKSLGRILPFSFTFEVSPTGALHLHGVVVPRDHSPEHLQLIRGALAKAGGKITGRSAARQVCFKPLTDGYGWATYSQKAFDEACNALGTYKVTFISEELTKMARDIHTARRSEMMCF